MRHLTDVTAAKSAFFSLAIVVFLMCMRTNAEAQISPFRGYKGPVLSEADMNEGTDAARKLLGETPPPVGASETWTGPASGNSGNLTVERAYRRQGHECRAVRSRVVYKAGTKRSLLLKFCRISSQWKLM